jgi:hypothetical protein
MGVNGEEEALYPIPFRNRAKTAEGAFVYKNVYFRENPPRSKMGLRIELRKKL